MWSMKINIANVFFTLAVVALSDHRCHPMRLLWEHCRGYPDYQGSPPHCELWCGRQQLLGLWVQRLPVCEEVILLISESIQSLVV